MGASKPTGGGKSYQRLERKIQDEEGKKEVSCPRDRSRDPGYLIPLRPNFLCSTRKSGDPSVRS